MAHPASQDAETGVSPDTAHRPRISVVVPVKDEQDNVLPLVEEIDAALAAFPDHEIVYVDDGSTDGTSAAIDRARQKFPRLRHLHHDRSCGQSRAIRTGVQHARGTLVITLDGDGQNDPADMPLLLQLFEQGSTDQRALGMVAGQRAKRRDSWVKRRSSRLANGLRRRLLDDDCVDTGCGLKLITRECFMSLPYFDHIHRFLPALVKREGYAVRFVDVNHRPRERGQSKYGTMNRLWVGIADLRGVMWLNRRCRRPNRIDEL